MTLRTRLQMIFGTTVLVSFASVLVFAALGIRKEMRSSLETIATETAGRYAAGIDARTGEALLTARTAARIFSNFERFATTDRRNTIDAQVRSLLERNGKFTSIRVFFEPDALDGLDARYAGTELGNDAGRFDIVWHNEGGLVERGRSTEAALVESELYATVKKLSVEVVLDPRDYAYGTGSPLPRVSATAPIHDIYDTFIGAVSIDLTLTDFQGIIDEVRPFGTGFAGLYTKNGYILAHRERALFSKNFTDEAARYLPEGAAVLADAIAVAEQVSAKLVNAATNPSSDRRRTRVSRVCGKKRWR
ncbi:MAG: hypothetical protein NT080_08735 [Spirochaetes bacterium]|nr:hypothetical protein [Spirochaetota bacterium]